MIRCMVITVEWGEYYLELKRNALCRQDLLALTVMSVCIVKFISSHVCTGLVLCAGTKPAASAHDACTAGMQRHHVPAAVRRTDSAVHSLLVAFTARTGENAAAQSGTSH